MEARRRRPLPGFPAPRTDPPALPEGSLRRLAAAHSLRAVQPVAALASERQPRSVRSTAATLGGGRRPACWPVRRRPASSRSRAASRWSRWSPSPRSWSRWAIRPSGCGIRRGGRRSLSSFVDARRFAGEIAWHYERDGVMPILVGHSQGGMVVIKTLHLLAERERPSPSGIPVTARREARTWIDRPAHRPARTPVGELRIAFAAVLATGSLPRLLLAQWDVLPILRDVPDSVVDFSGFSIPWDPIAGTGPTPPPFRATGGGPRAQRRAARELRPHRPAERRAPCAPTPRRGRGSMPGGPRPRRHRRPRGRTRPTCSYAADLWYSIKRHWCEAAQATPWAEAADRDAGAAQPLPVRHAALARTAPLLRCACRSPSRLRSTRRACARRSPACWRTAASRASSSTRSDAAYAFRGGAATPSLAILAAGGDPFAAAADEIRASINRPFPPDGAFDPFRFFVVADGEQCLSASSTTTSWPAATRSPSW